MARPVLALLVAGAVALLVPAAAAAADSIALSVSPAQPGGLEEFEVTASGNADSTDDVIAVTYKPAAGGTCPGVPSDDADGTTAVYTFASSPGSYSYASDPIALPHGAYLFCGWVFNTQTNTTTAHTQITVDVVDRNALSFSASPTALDDGGSTTLHFHGYTDTASDIDITRKPEGNGGCAPAPSTDGGTPLPGTSPVGVPGARAFDFDEGTTPGADEEGRDDAESPGRYLLCAWMVDGSDPPQVLAGPVSVVITLRPPHATLSLVSPFLAIAGTPFTVQASYERGVGTQLNLSIAVKPKPRSGRLCAATREKEPGEVIDVVRNEPVFGEGKPYTVKVERPGDYALCGWIERDPSDPAAAAVSGSLTVLRRGVLPAVFSGGTSQRRQLDFRFVVRRLYEFHFYARVRCREHDRQSTGYVQTTLAPIPVGRGGRFRARQGVSGLGGNVRIRGRVHGHRALGSLRQSFRRNGQVCRTGLVRFRAHAVGHYL